MTTIIYQNDFNVQSVGKRDKDSKRMITWQFEQGKSTSVFTDTHTVVFTWSLKSGKQSITMDGDLIWSGKNPGAYVFDHAWQQVVEQEQKLPHEQPTPQPLPQHQQPQLLDLRIVACRKAPTKSGAGFRCYELLIDGKSYFLYPYKNGCGETIATTIDEAAVTESILDVLFPNNNNKSTTANTSPTTTTTKDAALSGATPLPTSTVFTNNDLASIFPPDNDTNVMVDDGDDDDTDNGDPFDMLMVRGNNTTTAMVPTTTTTPSTSSAMSGPLLDF